MCATCKESLEANERVEKCLPPWCTRLFAGRFLECLQLVSIVLAKDSFGGVRNGGMKYGYETNSTDDRTDGSSGLMDDGTEYHSMNAL